MVSGESLPHHEQCESFCYTVAPFSSSSAGKDLLGISVYAWAPQKAVQLDVGHRQLQNGAAAR